MIDYCRKLNCNYAKLQLDCTLFVFFCLFHYTCMHIYTYIYSFEYILFIYLSNVVNNSGSVNIIN